MRYREGAITVGSRGRNSALEFHPFRYVMFTERFDKTGHFWTAHRYVVDKQIHLRAMFQSAFYLSKLRRWCDKKKKKKMFTRDLAFNTVEELGPKSTATTSKL